MSQEREQRNSVFPRVRLSNPFHASAFRQLDDYQLPSFSEDMAGDPNFRGKALDMEIQTEAEQEHRSTGDGRSQSSRLLITTLESTRSFQARASLIAAIHGELNKSSGKRASLLLFEVRLAVQKRQNNRIRRARFQISFRRENNSPSSPSSPNIHRISPAGTYFLNSSAKMKQEDKPSSGIMIGGTGPSASASLSRQYAWDVDGPEVDKDEAIMTGNLRFDNSGHSNGAEWSFQESSIKRDGVPNTLRAAILLTQEGDSPFVADFKLELQVGSTTTAFLGSKRRLRDTAAISINPQTGDIGELQKFDIGNLKDCLDRVDLDELLGMNLS